MPMGALAVGIQAGSALFDAAALGVTATGEAVRAVGSAGYVLATLPVREGAKVLSGETSVATLSRGCWRGEGRAWIEVRGLDGPGGDERGRAVVDALRGRAGVTVVGLNRPLSRVVVEISDVDSPVSLAQLCSMVAEAEKCCVRTDHTHQSGSSTRAESLPGDGLLVAGRAALVGINVAGLAVAAAGRALRLPAAPIAVDAAVSLMNYQPWLRRGFEQLVGVRRAHAALSVVTTAAHVVTLSPSTLAVDLALQALKAAEERAGARSWRGYEPRLAQYADHADAHRVARPVAAPPATVDRHGKRMAYVQAIGAGLVGVVTRNVAAASTAAVVAAPKAMRTTSESFAAALGQGLADRHAVLPLRPQSLRRLDRVDALLVDPRVLCGAELRVVRVRGAGSDQLATAWEKAQKLLGKKGLSPGWHRVPRMPSVRGADPKEPKEAVEALILRAHDPMASAVLAEARAAGLELVSVDVEALGELRTAFDEVCEVRPANRGGVGDELGETLTGVLADLQKAGRTVAVMSSAAGRALAGADVALGVMPTDDMAPPPWDADLLMAGLSGAWQVLHAIPAARQASQRGITISASASALGAVLMVPGARVPRGGPGPVTVGAAAGLLSGYLLARQVVHTAAPRPAPAYQWHAMSVEQVRAVLPTPDCAVDVTEPQSGRQSSNAVWTFVKAVRAELSDPLTPVMVVGSAATAMLGSPIDAVMVGTVLAGNAMLAAGQQLRAESRLNLLLAQQNPPARTVTVGPDGTPVYTEVAAERLRPGDVVEVRSNEVVPVDARVIEATDLEVDESSLTGESLSVGKQVVATPGAELAERSCMLYAGTTVIAGTAVALVIAVGPETQTRRAAELASGDLPVVGLQHQLSRLMYRAFPVSAGGGVLVGALGLLRRGGLHQALGDAIAVAVAAVPEGMPLMATLAQYASARRLTGTGALVRVPRSVEALGRIDVVCFDKTGTLSENHLRVTEVCPVSSHSDDDVLRCAAQAGPRSSGAAHAHATDQAIAEAAAQVIGADDSEAVKRDAYLPFRSGRAFSAAVSGGRLTIKGAPEVVLAACRGAGTGAHDAVAELASRGLRVITVAQRRLTAEQVQAVRKDPDSLAQLCATGLSLTGFLGLADTPRPEAPQLLADLADRGVAVRLITGDHPVTAMAIAAELGVEVTAGETITGAEWNALSRREQEAVVGERVIFARMSPENKVQVVQTLERSGRVCAMVGDGANDAAAIRVATVG
ncbi:MAG TPA: HAD-IC family P-type ATPase, partial [Mycobacterium sp.]